MECELVQTFYRIVLGFLGNLNNIVYIVIDPGDISSYHESNEITGNILNEPLLGKHSY